MRPLRFAAGDRTARALVCALVTACACALPGTAAGAELSETGTVVGLTPTTVSLQTAGPRGGLIDALIAGADALTHADRPYVWGGGHAAAGYPSIGSPGPGYNGRRVGYDCSGAVAAVLAYAGLWRHGASVPADYGVVSALRSAGVVVPGVGRGANSVTFYDFPGVHIFMNIAGGFFGTGDGGAGGDPAGGPGWLYDAALFTPNWASWDVTDPHFHAFHVVGGLLRSSAGKGSRYTFQLPGIEAAFAAGLQNGDQITVEFHQQPSSGALVADSLSYYGATTMSGTVTSVGADSLTVAGADGSVTTFSLGPVPSLAAGVQPGDTVTVSSTFVNGTPVAHSVMITATGSYPIEPATTTATKTTTSPSTGPVVLRQPRG